MHQIGTQIINFQPEIQYAITGKGNVTAQKFADPNNGNNRKGEGITEPDDTKESNTDKLIHKSTEMKHVNM